MTAFEVMVAADADKPDPNKRLSPMTEFLEENFGSRGKSRGNVNVDKSFTGSVRLVDKKTRVVEVLGPEPLGSRRPTDRKLSFDPNPYGPYRAGEVRICFQADGARKVPHR